MEKEFVSYEIALALKELGFDEKCLGGYVYKVPAMKWELEPIISDNSLIGVIASPTWQQAFRFFREKYNFVSEINVYSTSDGYSFSFKILCKKYTPYIEANNAWILYEDAELACIRKLIEIAKEQNIK